MSGKQAEHVEMKNSITRHHYDFGHVVLREMCSHNPMAFFQVMATPGKDDFLANLWRITCERCDAQGPASFSYKDVAVDPARIDDYPVILVTMPRPKVMTEAFYIAVVLLTPIEQIVAGNIPEKPSFGYYTLELGIAPDESEYTMLCSWIDGKHINLGEGPEAELSAFLQAVSEKLHNEHEMNVPGHDGN
jgi:hypothetical protein